MHSTAGLWIATQLIEFSLISTDKRASIQWSGQLPGGRLDGSNRQPMTFALARCLRCESDQFQPKTDYAFSGGKSRLGILRHVNGIQFFDKPLLRHSQT